MNKILVAKHLGHDSSISYIHEGRLYYIKFERLFQLKHVGGRYPKRIPINIMDNYIRQYLYRKHRSEFTFIDNDNYHSHHRYHYLSNDIMEKEPIDINIVVDGMGDNEDAWISTYKNHNLVDRKLISITGKGFGHGAYSMGVDLDIKGHMLDISGKFMGLQSYGKFNERHYEKIYTKFTIDFLGTSRKNKTWWEYADNNHLFYIDPDLPFQERLDVAHTIHYRIGELLLEYFEKHVKPEDRVGYSGGVAQNVVWNTMLKKHYPNLVIYPHCADDGQSLGMMEFYRIINRLPKFDMSRYPFMQEDETPNTEPTLDTIYKTAKFLSEGKIVAWYQGHGEIGPRALGHRSILMDPRIPKGKDIINQVKNRELYRPFGASVLSEYAKEYFDLDFENPYMLYLGTTQKSNLQSITHIDGTCRAQTVSPNTGVFRTLLEQFFDITGCPVLLNTSLNEAGKPIAGKIQNAMNEFTSKPIDVLVVGNDILIK